MTEWTLEMTNEEGRSAADATTRPELHSAACNSPHAGTPSGKGQYGYVLYYIDYPY